jgi:hypothetical protein
MVTLICIAIIAQNPPLMGQAMDDHGKVRWASSVTDDSKGNFNYSYTVKNEDDKLRCRINWKTIDWQTTVLPMKEDVSKYENQPVKPKVESGEFRYNGGVAAGEGVKDGKAYVQFNKTTAEGTEQPTPQAFVQLTIPVTVVENSAEITTYYPVDIRAESSAEPADGGWRLSYHVKISPTKLNVQIPGDVSDDVRKLLKSVRVEWESIASPLWSKMGPKEFNYGSIDEDRVLQFDKSGELSSAYELKVGLTVKQAPVFVSKSIRFVSLGRGQQGDRSVLAQVMLPAYAPQGAMPQK